MINVNTRLAKIIEVGQVLQARVFVITELALTCSYSIQHLNSSPNLFIAIK